MKKGLHPQINNNVVVTCACGNTFVTTSTKDAITVEICSNCHPFFTGKQKFIDTEGRIEKFEKKRALQAAKTTVTNKKKKKTDSATDVTKKPSLKELLEQARQTH